MGVRDAFRTNTIFNIRLHKVKNYGLGQKHYNLVLISFILT